MAIQGWPKRERERERLLKAKISLQDNIRWTKVVFCLFARRKWYDKNSVRIIGIESEMLT